MKTNGSTVVLLIAALLFGFFFRLGERRADAVPNCQASLCENIYCWWNAGATCFTAQKTGKTFPFAPGDNTTHAIPAVYVPASSGATTPLVANGTFDRWTWTNCTVTCQNTNGTFPSPQTAIPGGTASLPTGADGLTRNVCTPAAPPEEP